MEGRFRGNGLISGVGPVSTTESPGEAPVAGVFPLRLCVMGVRGEGEELSTGRGERRLKVVVP